MAIRCLPTNSLELELQNKGYKYIIGVDEAGRGCEKPDAEILTNNGWKYYLDVDVVNDKVLSFTLEDKMVWQSINALIEKDFVGELIELKNRSVHILVTPDHGFDVLRRTFKRDKSDNNKLKMTGHVFNTRKGVLDLLDNDYIPRGGAWFGDQKNFFVLPEVAKLKDDSGGKEYSEKFIPMNIWVAFLGIYLSEGSCRYKNTKDYGVVISQSRKSKEYDCIEKLLAQLPFGFRRCSVGFICYNKQLSSYLRRFGNKYVKYISEDIKNLSSELLNILIKWLIKGDGACYKGVGRQEVCTYYTVSCKLKDDIEEILLKAGWTYKTDFRKPRDSFIRGRIIKKENQMGCFEIRLRRNNKIACKHLHKKLVPYNGKVFCLSLPKYHNFYVRRSGSGYFTGNSLMGPVVAAAVHIPEGFNTFGINDSKKLSAKLRESLYNKIIEECKYSIHEINNEVIDEINIRESTKLAMQMCIADMVYDHGADYALIDGDFAPAFVSVPVQPIINGDNLSVSVAAASILAKVWRDAWVISEFHMKFPIYQAEKHKGYGTRIHKDALRLYGPCVYHRKSFSGVKEHVKTNRQS